MRISEIQDPYIRENQEYDGLRQEIRRLQKEFDEVPSPNWVKSLIKPIAEELVKAYPDRYYEILGPFGLGAHVSIHFYKQSVDEKHLFEDDNCLSITFCPGDLDKGELRVVDESVSTKDYPPNSVGAVNGFNHPETPVSPDSDVSEFLDMLEKQILKRTEQTEMEGRRNE